MELDQESCDSQPISIKHLWPGLHATNCRPKALERDVATSFVAHVTQEVVNQKVRGDKASGCKK